MTGKKTGNKGLKVSKESKTNGKFLLRVSADGEKEKRVVFDSSFLEDILKSALYQEICLTTFGTAALCFFALMETDVTEITFGEDDRKIFESCSIMIDNKDLSLALIDGRYLHIPLAKQWWNKFNV